jgi:hypothetical protein
MRISSRVICHSARRLSRAIMIASSHNAFGRHDRLFPNPRTKSRRTMSACRHNHATRRFHRLGNLHQTTRRSQIHSRHHRTGHTNHRPPRVAAAPDSSAANTISIRARQTSLWACSTKGRSRSLRYRCDFAAPFIVLRFYFLSGSGCST